MPKTLRAVIHGGKIEALEKVDLPDGAKVLVTLVSDDENEFWRTASEPSLSAIWNNPEDDVYAQLLKE